MLTANHLNIIERQMTKIESERLVLYPISDTELKKLTNDEPDAELKQAYSEMLQGCIEHPERRIWYTIWYIELKSQPGTVVGDLSFKGLNADGMVEIGYGLREGFCGNGYMTEAVQTICEWALSQEGVTRIEAETTAENRKSQRVLYSAGFIPSGDSGDEGPRFIYRYCESVRSAYEILEIEPTGSGYDLKKQFLIDGQIRYLYYSEMPDRCYIRGWSVCEISESNYHDNKRDPVIRYIGSFSGENDHRANFAVYRALKEGLYIKSTWEYTYGDIYLVEDLGIKKPLLNYEDINNDYYEVKLIDDSTRFLCRDFGFIRIPGALSVNVVAWYEIDEATYHAWDTAPPGIPHYIRYLGKIPSPSGYSSDWSEKEKTALYKALTSDVSIYPYVCEDDIVLKPGQCALHEPFEIVESVYDHDSNDKYHYAIWKVLLDGKDIVYLLLIQARSGNKTVTVYEIGENQLQNEYICQYNADGSNLQLIWKIDNNPNRRENIFRYSNVYHYQISSDPIYGGIPLNEALDAPVEYIRLVCTLPDTPDVFSEEFCKNMYRSLRNL